jgi:hypothetical protein
MGFQFEKLLRTLFMGSVASINATYGQAEEVNVDLSLIISVDEAASTPSEGSLGKKLVLKLYDKNDLIAISHRSHRSHSSHRSHYSSQGGHASHFSHYSSSSGTGTGTGSGGRSTGSSGTTTTPPPVRETPTPIETPVVTPSLAPKVYQLGDRMLIKGMVGADVTELINILIKRNYIKTADGSKYLIGDATFDETLETAVKLFQKNKSLASDGMVDPQTVYYLKH